MFNILAYVVGALLTVCFILYERHRQAGFVYLLLSDHSHTIFSVQPGNQEEAPVNVTTQGSTAVCPSGGRETGKENGKTTT